jgi:integrase
MGKAKASAKSLSGLSDLDKVQLSSLSRQPVLTNKRLDQLLNTSAYQARIKSDSSLSAQYVTLHSPGIGQEWDFETLREVHNRLKSYSQEVAAIFALQFEGCCRVSEVLNVKGSDIDKFGKVTVQSLKGGVKRIVSSSLANDFYVKNRSNLGLIFQGISRHFVYRVYKRFSIEAWFGDNVKASVTHMPRHLAVEAGREIGRSDELMKSQLGQKSASSTAHYGKKRRVKQ